MVKIKCGEIFPTKIYISNILDYVDNEKYKDYFLSSSLKDNNIIKSNRGGWQSENNLFKEKLFTPLLEKICFVIQSIIKDISKETPEFIINAMWGNVNSYGDYNLTHVHPRSWMSGVYYVNITEDSSGICFEDPRPARLMDFYQSFLSKDEFFTYNPKNGDLILFPSWIPHFVEPSKSQQKRISISFNVELIL